MGRLGPTCRGLSHLFSPPPSPVRPLLLPQPWAAKEDLPWPTSHGLGTLMPAAVGLFIRGACKTLTMTVTNDDYKKRLYLFKGLAPSTCSDCQHNVGSAPKSVCFENAKIKECFCSGRVSSLVSHKKYSFYLTYIFYSQEEIHLN